MIIGYSISSANMFPSIRYTGRLLTSGDTTRHHGLSAPAAQLTRDGAVGAAPGVDDPVCLSLAQPPAAVTVVTVVTVTVFDSEDRLPSASRVRA